MVSFFGLKLGGDKKKSDKGKVPERLPIQQAPRKWDQNLLGEGQYFGSNVGNRTVVNGSIRSVNMSRPGTASSTRISPYNHNTHALAASSMYDLSNLSHHRQGSFHSLKPASSEAYLRTNFNNASMTSLQVPGPGFGSRPGTPGSSRTKAWVNPLDVHFGRTTPSTIPPAPKSPLGQFEITPRADEPDGSLMFGDKAENVAQAIMASVEQKEQEKLDKEREQKAKMEKQREERARRLKAEEEAKEKERQREREREQEKLMEQENQKETAAAAAPAVASPPNVANRPMNRPMDRPIFHGQPDQRPSGRNGSRNNGPGPIDRPMIQGQGDHRPDSRNGNRPGPGPGSNHRPHFQGPRDQRPGSRNGQHEQRPRFQGPVDQRPGSRNGLHDRPHLQGQMDHRPGSRNGNHDRALFHGQTDMRPGSRSGQRRDGPPNGHLNGRSLNGPGPMRSPGVMNGHSRGPVNGSSAMNSPKNSPTGAGPINSPNRPAPREFRQEQNSYYPRDSPSPTGSFTHRNDDHSGQSSKPVIRNVAARRDTLASMTPRRNSLSMTIEAFEKSIDGKVAAPDGRRNSDASSNYSVDGVMESPVQAQPTSQGRRPSPPYAAVPAQRSHSPMRRPIPGKGVQRPGPNEYGVAPARLNSPSPPSKRTEQTALEPAPLFRQPNWAKEDEDFRHDDFTTARPGPPPSHRPPLTPTFGGPPSPDQPNWPLASPAATATRPPVSSSAMAPPLLKRRNPPAPLNFDFSPNAYSREHGPFTPPVRMLSQPSPGLMPDEGRPSTADEAGIGMARGPSVREPRGAFGTKRRPDYGLRSPTGIADDFGTPLI